MEFRLIFARNLYTLAEHSLDRPDGIPIVADREDPMFGEPYLSSAYQYISSPKPNTL